MNETEESTFRYWTGPNDDDWADSSHTALRTQVPPDRWPYGPPEAHEDCCLLHEGGLYCDCAWSAADE